MRVSDVLDVAQDLMLRHVECPDAPICMLGVGGLVNPVMSFKGVMEVEENDSVVLKERAYRNKFPSRSKKSRSHKKLWRKGKVKKRAGKL